MTGPNPGSDEAVAAGCNCPRLNNCHGKGFPWPRKDGREPNEEPRSFWIRTDCPLHGAGLFPWLDQDAEASDS